MKRNILVLVFTLVIGAFACDAMAIDQAMPSQAPSQAAATPDQNAAQEHAKMERFSRQDRTGFQKQIQLDQFRLLGIQHLDQVKIIDSWARQSLRKIRQRESIDGQDPVYTALDMSFRPEAWFSRNIIYVQSVPIREELGRIAGDDKEAKRIREEALVSPMFISRDDVQQRLDQLGTDSRQASAVNQVNIAASTFFSMSNSLLIVPPPVSDSAAPWMHPDEITKALLTSFPPSMEMLTGATAPAVPAKAVVPDTMPYSLPDQGKIVAGFQSLAAAWQDNDAAKANRDGIAPLLAVLPTINPRIYPKGTRATVEFWYNRTFSGTLDAFVYFLAMVLFFQVAIGNVKRGGKVQKIALCIYGFALLGHLTAMGVRWWIDGRIPIQNEFESVMGSAAIGCFIGLILESWKRSGIFGAAFGFVGFLSGAALLASPYVFGTDPGSAPGKVAGILNTYWLYIHVDVVIASYALIAASFVIAVIYLGMRQWHWINPIEPGFDERGSEGNLPEDKPRGRSATTTSPAAETQPALTTQQRLLLTERTQQLDTLDQANMVVLQMAFWFLGIGIMCGAVWADQSWGRPWGWDPKETFALVTWMVYLVIVHVRLVIKQKADMTAWLSIAGFAIMMFNWIGVNFFLKGLHSYA